MPPIITCAAALNPCFNVSGVELLIESISTDLECFDDDFATKAKERFNKSLEGLYNIYFLKYGNPTQSTSAASSSRSNSGNPMTQLLNRLRENSNKRAKNDRLASNEYERYVTTDFISHIPTEQFRTFDVLGFWKAKEQDFPDHLVTTDRIQHTLNLENALEFEEGIFDEEVLANEAILLFEEIAVDEAASEARSNGSGEEIEITSDKQHLFSFIFPFPTPPCSSLVIHVLSPLIKQLLDTSHSGSGGPSHSPSWKEDSFEINVLLEESETEGTSARSSGAARDEAGPPRQDYINRSFEASMRNRILRLEQDDSPYLLGKAKGTYWSDIRLMLEHAPSQNEYNRLLEFENALLII
ncbi:hypothetical protein Tco_0399915 [Tanacetum coccineum]